MPPSPHWESIYAPTIWLARLLVLFRFVVGWPGPPSRRLRPPAWAWRPRRLAPAGRAFR